MKNLFVTLFLGILGITTYAQDNLTGTWKAENQNTLVKIEKVEGVYIGKIISSDNKDIKPGTQIIKDVHLKKDKWVGQMYAPKRREWYDIELNPKEKNLEITISVGFYNRTVEWSKKNTDN